MERVGMEISYLTGFLKCLEQNSPPFAGYVHLSFGNFLLLIFIQRGRGLDISVLTIDGKEKNEGKRKLLSPFHPLAHGMTKML